MTVPVAEAGTTPGRKIRTVLALIHRWTSLGIVLFVAVAAITGSVLAFNVELERVFAPHLFATSRDPQLRLNLASLAERAEAMVPQGRVLQITYTEPDQASVYFIPRVDAASGKTANLGFTEFFVDPWTGRELGRRNRADLSEGWVNVMPFVYELHWRLVGGETGQWIMGITAIVWTINCLVGFFLTLPSTSRDFFKRWKPSWLVRTDAGSFRFQFDLHRAIGLWLWPALLVFSWSAVMMNQRPLYERVMTALTDFVPYQPRPPHHVEAPKLDWKEALGRGDRLMSSASSRLGFRVGEPQSLMYDPDENSYLYMVRGSRDVFQRSPKGGGTCVTFDADTGAEIEVSQPTGEHLGNTIESWLYALHMARVFGRPYQVFVVVVGLAIAVTCITGLWMFRRRLVRQIYRGGAKE
jgi:uncharacterized iron-regulated membrane protein